MWIIELQTNFELDTWKRVEPGESYTAAQAHGYADAWTWQRNRRYRARLVVEAP